MDAELSMVIQLEAPSNVSAPPNRPAAVHVAPPPIVPVLPLPDRSVTVVPVPSLNPYAATSPVCAAAGTEHAMANTPERANADTNDRRRRMITSPTTERKS